MNECESQDKKRCDVSALVSKPCLKTFLGYILFHCTSVFDNSVVLLSRSNAPTSFPTCTACAPFYQTYIHPKTCKPFLPDIPEHRAIILVFLRVYSTVRGASEFASASTAGRRPTSCDLSFVGITVLSLHGFADSTSSPLVCCADRQRENDCGDCVGRVFDATRGGDRCARGGPKKCGAAVPARGRTYCAVGMARTVLGDHTQHLFPRDTFIELLVVIIGLLVGLAHCTHRPSRKTVGD